MHVVKNYVWLYWGIFYSPISANKVDYNNDCCLNVQLCQE